HHALVIEAGHQDGHAVPDAAEDVLRGNFAILKHQFAGVGAAHAELVELLRSRKALETLLDQKRRDAARADIGIGLGVDHQHLGLRAVGDPHLAAVEDVTVALLLRARLHRDDVGAGTRLGHGEPAYVLAGDELAEIAPLLIVAAVAADLVDAEVRVRAVGQPDRGRGAREFLPPHAGPEVTKPRPPPIPP